jgi:hypothetical protein
MACDATDKHNIDASKIIDSFIISFLTLDKDITYSDEKSFGVGS